MIGTGIIVEKVIGILAKQFKLDKVLDYVEKPNDLDKQMNALYKKVDKYGKYIEQLEKDLAEVEKNEKQEGGENA